MEGSVEELNKLIDDMDQLRTEILEKENQLESMRDAFVELLENNINHLDFAGTVWTLRLADSLSANVPYCLQLHLDLELRPDLDSAVNEERFSWLRLMRYMSHDRELYAPIQLSGDDSSVILTIKKYKRGHVDLYLPEGLSEISMYIDFGTIQGLIAFLDEKKIVLSQSGISLEKIKINSALKEFSRKAAFVAQVEDSLSGVQVAGYYGEYTKKENKNV